MTNLPPLPPLAQLIWKSAQSRADPPLFSKGIGPPTASVIQQYGAEPKYHNTAEHPRIGSNPLPHWEEGLQLFRDYLAAFPGDHAGVVAGWFCDGKDVKDDKTGFYP